MTCLVVDARDEDGVRPSTGVRNEASPLDRPARAPEGCAALHGRRRSCWGVAALATLLAACGGGGGGGTDPAAGGGGGGGGGGATATGLASDCFNPAMATVGTSFRLDYQVVGAATGTASRVGTVTRQTSFDTQADATEIETESTASITMPGTPGVVERLLTRNYVRLDGMALVEYGFVEQVLSDPTADTTRRVYTPPRRDARAGLAVGQSLEISTTATDTVTSPGGTVLSVDSQTGDERITYRGQELITVPAGSFVACRFDYEPEGAGGPVDVEWLQVGAGVQLRYLSGQGTGFELAFELLPSSRLNGAPL